MMSPEQAPRNTLTPLSVEEFVKKELSAQRAYLIDTILKRRPEYQEVPWELLYRFCSNDIGGAISEYGFNEMWEPKKEHDVISAVFYRMQNGGEPEATRSEFVNFLSWVSKSKDVSDLSKDSVLNNMKKANLSEELSVLICRVLQKQINNDADNWLRTKTPPTLASLMLLERMNKNVDVDRKIRGIDLSVAIAENLSLKSDFFNTIGGVYQMARDIVDSLDFTMCLPTERPYARLHILRRMFDYAAAGVYPENLEDTARLMIEEIETMLHDNNRHGDERKSALRPTVGVEYQGESDDTVGLSPVKKRMKFIAGKERLYTYATTKVFRNIFSDIAEFAGFTPSDDFYYEYCFPPTVSPKMQHRMLYEIQCIEAHLVGRTNMEMSVQPNFGGVRYEQGVFEELTQLQFMLFGAGYGIRPNEFSHDPNVVTWGNPYQLGGYKGGAMSYQRDVDLEDSDGIQRVNGKRPEVVSEMRMPVVHSFSEAVRFVQYSSDLAILAKAYQRYAAGTRALPKEASLAKNWLMLLEKTNHIFQRHGFDFTEVIEVPAEREKFALHVLADLGAIAALSPTSHQADEREDYHNLLVVQMRQLLVEYRREALAIEREYRQKYLKETYE